MGEYADYAGESVKIGTCEDLYYLRADQIHQVKPQRGSVDPFKDRNELRFRFPFPDEDNVKPGEFEPFNRSHRVYGATVPEGVKHYSVQFKATNDNGYLVSLPCPESSEQVFKLEHGSGGIDAITIHRNGYGGAVGIVQQRYWEGRLVVVCECRGCGAKYRVETLESAEELIAALEADTSPGRSDYVVEIVDRIRDGYLTDEQRADRAEDATRRKVSHAPKAVQS